MPTRTAKVRSQLSAGRRRLKPASRLATPSGFEPPILQTGRLSAEEGLHVASHFGMQSGSNVAIGIEGERNGAMPEEFLHHLRVDAATKEMGGGRVPKIVNPNAR